LDSLVSLEKLWIEENKIETLEGLQSLTNLKELNVAGNYIEVIGMGLDCLVSLEELNISNNRVGNFKEVLNLNRLPELKTCTF
jgi:Leucine-rich repeat (LRR) protein